MDSAQNSHGIDPLIERIESAIARINAAALKLDASGGNGDDASPSSAKVMALVNRHEAMREEVAGTLRDLDKIIGKLEN